MQESKIKLSLMNKELDLETYLSISPNEFGIYLFDKKDSKNLYKQLFKFDNIKTSIDLGNLKIFLEDNIFKIEKLIGKFINNISLIIENDKVLNVELGIKKKNYQENINKKYLENLLIDVKDVFQENYQNDRIMHMIIKRYLVNGNEYSSYEENFIGDYLCLEVQFKIVPINIILEIEKVLDKYHINLSNCIDGGYMKDFFNNDDVELSKMAYRLQNNFNHNEVKLVPKNIEKKGFFEKFFQLFS